MTKEQIVLEVQNHPIDKVFILLRDYIPGGSWTMGLIFIVGFMVVITFVFKKQISQMLKILSNILNN